MGVYARGKKLWIRFRERSSAVFTHEEVETIISDARIPPDRQMAYAIELLAGVRPG